MVEFQTNPFKRALREGRLQIGLWSSLCSNIAAEIISDSGFDWICSTWSTRRTRSRIS